MQIAVTFENGERGEVDDLTFERYFAGPPAETQRLAVAALDNESAQKSALARGARARQLQLLRKPQAKAIASAGSRKVRSAR